MTDNKVSSAWKTTSIILIVILASIVVLYVFSTASYNRQMKNENICLYDICGDYPYGEYDSVNKVCDCYDYDVLGDLTYATSEYMGRR